MMCRSSCQSKSQNPEPILSKEEIEEGARSTTKGKEGQRIAMQSSPICACLIWFWFGLLLVAWFGLFCIGCAKCNIAFQGCGRHCFFSHMRVLRYCMARAPIKRAVMTENKKFTHDMCLEINWECVKGTCTPRSKGCASGFFRSLESINIHAHTRKGYCPCKANIKL